MDFVSQNLVDVIAISGTRTPTNCNEVAMLLKPIIKETPVAIPDPSTTQTILSVNRCGPRFQKFALGKILGFCKNVYKSLIPNFVLQKCGNLDSLHLVYRYHKTFNHFQ